MDNVLREILRKNQYFEEMNENRFIPEYLGLIVNGVVIYNGEVNTLQHEKDQVKEVKKDMDCGITLENCQDYKEGDIIEVYELVEIPR